MAVEPMKFVTLAAPAEQFDEIALNCVIDQQFHPENAMQMMKQVRHLRPLPTTNPYTPLVRQADSLLSRLGADAAYQPAKEQLTLEQAQTYLTELEKKLDGMDSRTAALRQEVSDDKSAATSWRSCPALTWIWPSSPTWIF